MINRLKMVVLLLCSFSITHASDFFSSCRFHFGTEISKVYNIDNNTTINAGTIAEVDYFTGPWAGSSETFNLGNFFKACKTLGKTPVVVAYIIAFAAKRDLKIDDCNVSQNNLCKKGAGYIRNNRIKILNIYSAYAKGIASTYGTDKPVIWCMEPDYSQYTDSMQEGGGISYADAGTLISDIISTIKKDLPKSMFSMDISHGHHHGKIRPGRIPGIQRSMWRRTFLLSILREGPAKQQVRLSVMTGHKICLNGHGY